MTNHVPVGQEPIIDLTEVVPRPADQAKMGWVSPAYTKSRTLQLDAAVLRKNRCVAIDHHADEVELYRMLRAQILRCSDDKRGNTLMITSALPREGKTLTAINLSMALAREFSQTALLVDCDLRQQQVHNYLSYQSDKGLVDYLLYGSPLSDLIVWPGIEKLTIISGGRTIGASSELLGSPGMASLINEMKSRYPNRQVIFDAPPLLTCSDSLALAPLVDSILLVVQAGKTSRKDIKKALELLPREKVIGIVFNRTSN